MTAFQLMLLAHVLTDFVLQWDQLVYLKNSRKLKGFFYHGMILFILQTLLLFTLYSAASAVLFSLIVTLVHLLIDYGKEFISSKRAIGKLIIFVGDQVLHILIILFLSSWFSLNAHSFLTDLFVNIVPVQLSLLFFNRLLTALIILIYLCFGGAILIRLTLDVIYRHVDNYMQAIAPEDLHKRDPIKEVRVGKYVGIMERSILFIFLINGEFSAVGFVIAAKSLTRFNQLSHKNFAEYYLIGTLLSILLTVLGVLLYQQILQLSVLSMFEGR
jgi:hypothetical protein